MSEMSQNDFQKPKERILYLDIDDTLLVHTRDYRGYAAPKAAEFFRWAKEHFEVRWLTMWCMNGTMNERLAVELSQRFCDEITPGEFLEVINPKRLGALALYKTEGIDFADLRPWVWIEDGLIPNEKNYLKNENLFDNFYKTNVTHDITALQVTWRKLAKKFDLPDAPEPPYDTVVKLPLNMFK